MHITYNYLSSPAELKFRESQLGTGISCRKMTCTTMFALKVSKTNHHMPISKMPKHEILNKCGSQKKAKDCYFFLLPIFYGFWPPRAHITQKSQIYSTILHIKSEKYRPDLALTLSLYLYGGLFLILHIKYWSTYLYVVIYAQAHHMHIICIYCMHNFYI